MNTHTAKKLLEFCEAINTLTAAIVLHIGVTTAGDIISASENLKSAIKNDETIKETT